MIANKAGAGVHEAARAREVGEVCLAIDTAVSRVVVSGSFV